MYSLLTCSWSIPSRAAVAVHRISTCQVTSEIKHLLNIRARLKKLWGAVSRFEKRRGKERRKEHHNKGKYYGEAAQPSQVVAVELITDQEPEHDRISDKSDHSYLL